MEDNQCSSWVKVLVGVGGGEEGVRSNEAED